MVKEKAVKGVVCLVAIAMLTGVALAKKPQGQVKAEVTEQKGTKTEVQAMELKPIMEYKLLEDEEVVDVIFDEAEVTVKKARVMGVMGLEQKKATETVKVQYPKVVVTKNAVKFLDEKGKMKSEYQLKGRGEWTGVMISKNKKYLNVHTILNHITEEAESVMLNDEGNVLWSVKHNLFGVYPSPNGKYIVGIPTIEWGDAPICVYNEKGLVKEIKKDSRSWKLSFSKDGSWFAVTLAIRIEGKEKYRADLIVFDDKGNELWRKNSIARGDAAYSCPIDITDDDIITVITGGDEYKIYHFDKKGNLIKEEQGNLKMFREFKR